MQAHQLLKFQRTVVLLAVGMLALFALAACGSDDEDAPAAGGLATQIPAPTTAPAPAPPAAAMVPATAPELGSDDEQIMAVLEKQVRAVNAADYVAFQETCTPSAGKPPTVDQLKFVFEVMDGAAGGATTAAQVHFSPQGYNVRNVEVKLLRAPFAQASFDIYDYDEYVAGRPSLKTFEKVDGQWYSESAPCEQA